jgi:hypothetical protein
VGRRAFATQAADFTALRINSPTAFFSMIERTRTPKPRFTLDSLPAPDDYSEAFRACQSSGDVMALHGVIEAGWPADALLVYARNCFSRTGSKRRHATPSAYRFAIHFISQSSPTDLASSAYNFVRDWRRRYGALDNDASAEGRK